MSIIHFKKEDILGYDQMENRDYNGKLKVNINQTKIPSISFKGKTQEEIELLLPKHMANAVSTIAPDNHKPPTVN